MKKRILAVLLVLAMIVVAGVVAVSATHPDSAACKHCPAEEIEWKEWNAEAGASVTEGGHYYLNANVEELSSNYFIGTAETPVDVVLDLRGFSITSATTRVFYVRAGSTLSLMDSNTETPGAITGGALSASGGVIYGDTGTAENRTAINLYNVVIDSNVDNGADQYNGYTGGAIYAGQYVDVLVDGATIHGGYTRQGGSLYLSTNASFTMNSGLINEGQAAVGGNLWIGGTATINGGTISGGISKEMRYYKTESATTTTLTNYGGGNAFVNSGAKLTISDDAIIEGGENAAASKDGLRGGGNIYNTGTVNVNGGIIRNGATNASGGNIFNRATLEIAAGQIYGGSAMTDAISGTDSDRGVGGGNIATRATDGKTTISGGEITDGSIAIVYTSGSGFLKLSGTPVIESIAMATATPGFVLTIDEGGLTEGAAIGVSVALDTAFTAESADAADAAQYFYNADRSVYTKAVAEENVIKLVENTSCSVCGKDVTWTAWDGASVATVSGDGHYYLTKNVTSGGRVLMGTTDVVQSFCLDFNGYSIHKTGTGNRVIYTRAGTTVHLMNSSPIISELSSQVTSSGGVIYTEGNATNNSFVHIYDGLKLYNNATGDLTSNGSVIYAATNCVVNMHGGTVIGHNNTKIDGGVNVLGTFNMDGGKIIGADAAVKGGAIYVKGHANISGGTITGGTATNGGSIYVDSSAAELNVSGTALIENGRATSFGGSIYNSGATVNISGGTITGGKTDDKAYGGGNIYNTGKLNISGTAIIEKGMRTNATTSSIRGGGNIYNTGTLNISGGIIRDGIVAKSDMGANIHMNGGTITVSGGTISGGTVYDGKTNAEELSGIKGIAFRAGTGIIKGDPVIDDIGNSMYKSGDTISGWSTLTISGKPTIGLIDGATIDSADYRLITLGENGVTGGSITVNAAEGVPFSAANAEWAESSKAFFFGADGLVGGVDADGCLILVEAVVACPHCGEFVEWAEWTGGSLTTAAADGKHYVLTKDVTSGGQIYIGNDPVADKADTEEDESKPAVVNNVVIDLAGYSITKGGRVFAIYAGSTLNLVNTSATESVLSGAYTADSGGVINMTGASHLTMAGKITAKSTAAAFNHNGGIVNVGDGTLLLKDGVTLIGQNATYGGAVCVEGGSFTMEGGTINGGHISGHKEVAEGGAVYLKNAKFTMTGGKISGGSVEAAQGTSASMGGNIYAAGSTLTISGGTIEKGTATNGNGGNILLASGSLTVSGTAQITGGNATRSFNYNNGGGNIYGMPSAKIYIEGGSVSGGQTNAVGGNVLVRGYLTIASRDLLSGGSSVCGFANEVAAYATDKLTITDLGENWDGDILLYQANIVDNPVGVALCQYVQGARDNYDVWYSSVEKVLAADTEESSTYVDVLVDGEYDLGDHFVDISGNTVTINNEATCFDSANNGFDAAACGSATMTAPATYVNAPNGNLYITVAEDGENQYSFHRLEMRFDSAYLRPRNAGIYYSSIWNGDEVLVGTLTEDGTNYATEPKIIGYGTALKKGAAADGTSFNNPEEKFAYTYFQNAGDGLVNNFLVNKKGDKINSCLLSGIIKEGQDPEKNSSNAATVVYATPYVQIYDYTGKPMFVMGSSREDSLNSVVKAVVDAINAETDDDVKADNIQKISKLQDFAETCGVTFDGLSELVESIAPAEPTPDAE